MREGITTLFQAFSLIYWMTEGKLFFFLSPAISTCVMFLSSRQVTLRAEGRREIQWGKLAG